MSTAKHVVIVPSQGSDPGSDMLCRRCGGREPLMGPRGNSIAVITAMTNAFIAQHRGCNGPEKMPPPPASVEKWAQGDDFGVSSATIWTVLAGRRFPRAIGIGSPPWDPSDFGRCHRLLQVAPEWRPRLPE